MMKINEIGKFVLIDENSHQYDLKDITNLICIRGSEIFTGTNAVDICNRADTIFTINFSSENITLIKSVGKVYVNNKEVMCVLYKLSDNIIISTEKAKIKFRFLCEKSNIQKLIDLFMDGNLDYPLDMDYYFYEYAKQLRITDSKAISHIMASIDIPEIDNL